MRLKTAVPLVGTLASVIASAASAAVTATLTPLATFGGGDGFRAPGEVVTGDAAGTTNSGGSYAYLGTANLERGLAYNPTTGNLLLVSRANPTGTNGNNIRILNSATGADQGGLSSAGIAGGTFGVNNVGVAGDGAIYVGNLQGATSATANYTIYRYANEAATNTIAFAGNPAATTVRIGDAFDVTGSGTGTRIVAGYNNANGYAVFSTADGSTFSATSVSVTGTAAGDFRFSDAFGADANNVLGAGNGTNVRNSTYSGSTGTLVNTIGVPPLQSTAERLLDYAVVGTTPVLLTQSTGDGRVRAYDATNLSSLVLLATSTAQAGLTANANSAGQITFGNIDNVNGTATIYALSTNQGIQAFNLAVTIPEPTTLAALALGGLFLRRRRR